MSKNIANIDFNKIINILRAEYKTISGRKYDMYTLIWHLEQILETPPSFRSRCYQVAKDYISGNRPDSLSDNMLTDVLICLLDLGQIKMKYTLDDIGKSGSASACVFIDETKIYFEIM